MTNEMATYYNANLYGLDAIENSISRLLKSVAYLDEAEQQLLVNCCFFAATAHEGQKRQSGEPYICHPIKVAEILAHEVQFNLPVLQAAVLHDVIEDTPVSKDEVAAAFSEEVADLVDGVSKLEKDKDVSPQELQARTFAKLVVAMEADPRVVMIKFADRMHNMQTLGALRPDKRRRIAQETLDVYVPIASRLGMYIFKTELEELAFKNLHPWRYETVEKLAEDTHPEREAAFFAVREKLTERFEKDGIKARLRKRRRNLYSVYKKLQRAHLTRRPLENASIPLVAITDSIDDCYRVLGVIHRFYRPISNKLVDYIASPKTNGYQSIHTAVLTPEGRVINFQIRTQKMHTVAEAGIIAIWREHNQPKGAGSRLDALARDKSMRRWLGNIKDLSTLVNNPIEFYEAVKRDLIDFEIQVLTPKGEPIALPKGATVIDFAYHIHTELGDHLQSAMVNGVAVALDYQLGHGQSVELFASPSAMPKAHWLKRVKTARARTAIRHYLRDLPQGELEQLGYEEIKNHLSRRKIRYRYLNKMLEIVAQKDDLSLSELLQRIALHDISRARIRSQLQKISQQNGVTTTFTVRIINQPGALGAIADTIGRNEANILRIDFPEDMHAEEVIMQFVIHLPTLKQLASIVDELSHIPLVKTVNHEENIV